MPILYEIYIQTQFYDDLYSTQNYIFQLFRFVQHKSMLKNLSKTLFKSLLNPTRFRLGQSVLSLKRQKQAKLAKKLKQAFNPTYLQVTDTTLSGSSCGQMYKIIIQSPLFNGKSRVAQHQMVSECLEQDLKTIHAFNLKTKVPKTVQQKPVETQAQKKQQ